jgi:hypothetical protein
VAGLVFLASPSAAITLGQLDDFQDGTLQGWEMGHSTTAVNTPDVGPAGAGDRVLEMLTAVRVVIFNEAQWTGDYTAAGVTQISMDVKQQSNFTLQLRLAIGSGEFGPGGSGDTYVTNYAIPVAQDGQWHHIVFDVKPSDFVATLANPSPPGDPAAALSSVSQLRLIHNPTAMDFRGAMGEADFYVDNISALGSSVAANADFTGDGHVDGADFLRWQRHLNSGTMQSQGDADGDGLVNAADLAAWKTKFTSSASAAARTVPEPRALSSWLGCLALLLASTQWRTPHRRRTMRARAASSAAVGSGTAV